MSNIIFAGVASNQVNAVIERFPARPIPTRRYNVDQIPGRSGDLLTDLGAYDNMEQTYEIYIRQDGGTTFQESCNMVAEWLLKPIGYQKLSDSYDNHGSYRYAYFAGPANVASVLNQFGRAEIVLNCKPFKYLTIGDNQVTINGVYTITNPTGFDAAPLIQVKGASGYGTSTIQIGSYTISLSDVVDDMIIDCELMDCYKGTTNLNSLVTLSPTYTYPKFVPGSNAVKLTGAGINAIKVTPRWRTL